MKNVHLGLPAARDIADRLGTEFGVEAQEAPHPAARLAPAGYLDLTRVGVLPQHLDLLARLLGAVGVLALGRVVQHLQGLLQIMLALVPLLLGEPHLGLIDEIILLFL